MLQLSVPNYHSSIMFTNLQSLPLKILKVSILFVGAATLVASMLVIFDPFKQQPVLRDKKRVTDLQQYLDLVAAYNMTEPIAPFSSSETLKQVGTAESGCALTTEHCTITNDSCANLRFILPDATLDLPQDPQTGTKAKTGYAVMQESSGKITFIACGSETKEIEEGRVFEKNKPTR